MIQQDIFRGFPTVGTRSFFRQLWRVAFIGGLCLLILQVSAQDSTHIRWSATSTQLEQGHYTIRFEGKPSKGWQLYAPDADFGGGIRSVVLSFSDSSLKATGALTAAGKSRTIKSPIFDNKPFTVYEDGLSLSADVRISGPVPGLLMGTLQYTYGKGDEFYPLESFPFSVKLEGGVQTRQRIIIPTIDLAKPLQDCGSSGPVSQKGIGTIFLLGFLGGLLALVTPCVFPMIPLTVSFFTKRAGVEKNGTGQAILYGGFIFLIYIAFSIPFHLIGRVSPTIYNDISTNIWLNIAFFAIFIVFAVSFFGYFEITLPSGLANSASTKHGTNIAGIFFMALTLAIVSFSCTGPILGTLLVGTASGGAWPLTAGLAGFGLALGLPFALFAVFPQWLHALPRSGGWLHTVKVVLGFIELALALKFFSNADLVAHWGLLKRELFFGLWIIVFLGLFTYLMGWLRFKEDVKGAHIGLPRRLFAFAVLLFTLYLVPGVTNTTMANISLVSGFPPPACYSIYAAPVNCEAPLKDYDQAIELAKREHKPVMIDFTGWACVNCRKMEENVWTKPEVKALMEKYILVSLYVDDKMKLPATAQFTYMAKDGAERRISTVGDKWATFQTENFNASSQPWYVLVTPDERLLTAPVGYTPDPAKYAAWLKCGLDAFAQSGK
jgi:cytochrome c biogenesis protein CcdA